MEVSGLRIHHVGFVVASIRDSAPRFVETLGACWGQMVFEDPLQRVKVTFLGAPRGLGPPGSDTLIELVEPWGDDSPVLRFLRQKGGGLHHICYETADLGLSLKAMREHGALLVQRPKPAVAFDGRHIAWVLTTEKLLVELLDTSGGASGWSGSVGRVSPGV